MLTLSQKSYLADLIGRLCPELNDKSYEIAGYFSEAQRGLFLSLTRQGKQEEAKEIIDNVKNLQAHI